MSEEHPGQISRIGMIRAAMAKRRENIAPVTKSATTSGIPEHGANEPRHGHATAMANQKLDDAVSALNLNINPFNKLKLLDTDEVEKSELQGLLSEIQTSAGDNPDPIFVWERFSTQGREYLESRPYNSEARRRATVAQGEIIVREDSPAANKPRRRKALAEAYINDDVKRLDKAWDDFVYLYNITQNKLLFIARNYDLPECSKLPNSLNRLRGHGELGNFFASIKADPDAFFNAVKESIRLPDTKEKQALFDTKKQAIITALEPLPLTKKAAMGRG
jgi:hypothetical protein